MSQRISGYRRIFFVFGAGLLFLSFVPGLRNLWLAQSDDRVEIRIAGEWLKKNARMGSVIFGSDTRICYYAGEACGRFVTLQRYKAVFDGQERASGFMKKMRVAWIVGDSFLEKRYYSQLAPKIQAFYGDDQLVKKAAFGDISIYKRLVDPEGSSVSNEHSK